MISKITKEKKNNKIYLGEDGIVYVDVVKTISEKEVLDLFEQMKGTMKVISIKPKIMIINLITSSILRSYRFRKSVGEKFKEIVFEKAAIYEENIFSRTVASFIIGATGIKNVRIFKDKAKAVEWLKEI